MDTRKTDRKRTKLFNLKLHDEELDRLRAIAEANFRSPAEQIRYWIAKEPTQ